MSPAPPTVRAYRDSDLADVYDVCVRTGAAGADARGRYSSDALVPDVFAGPYLHLEPDLAVVLDDGERVVGYVLGTADTARFVEAYRERWIPRVAHRYEEPEHAGRTSEDELVATLLRPERTLRAELMGYPAHLHIDLLPAHQGAGHGRRLMGAFLRAVAGAGAPAVHLGVATGNTRARTFYDRLGFHEIPVPGGGQDTTYLGRSTSW